MNITNLKSGSIFGAYGLAKVHLAAMVSQNSPVVLVATTGEEAEDALRNIRFFLGSKPDAGVLYLPSDDRTPFDATSLDPVITMERMSTLHKLATSTPFQVLVTSVDALLKRNIPFPCLQESTELIELGGDIDRDALLKNLTTFGYANVPSVEDPGTYALRGSIIDIFWPGERYPCRIDLFGDTVERLFLFDPSSHRTVSHINTFQFGPVREVQLTDKNITWAQTKLRDLADELEYPTKKLREKLEDLENKVPFFGIESVLPAFFEDLDSPLEILAKSYNLKALRITILDDMGLANRALEIHAHYDAQYGNALVRGDLVSSPQHFLHTHEELLTELKRFEVIQLHSLSDLQTPDSLVLKSSSTLDIRQDILTQSMRTDDGSTSEHHLLDPLAQRIKSLGAQGISVFLPVSSQGGAHRLSELLKPYRLHIVTLPSPPDLVCTELDPSLSNPSIHAYTFVAKPEPPSQGAVCEYARFAVFCEEDIFGKRSRRHARSGKQSKFKTSLSDLNCDDPVVHVDHGLGLFKGLTKLNVRGIEQDYLLLVYASDDKLYLPVHRINMIQPYSGADGNNLRLDKLGGSGWQSKKTKVKEAVMAMAQDLLHLYARREIAKRPVFSAPQESYWEFESRFPFETTPDQQKAIDDVIADMMKERPMDRLICGDVGYGKTEVSMRAAMLTVASGKQVAVLAPTTILAHQHGMNFKERFADSSIIVETVSRFQKPSEVRETLKRLKDGKVDILIGTHRLLSDDVSFKNLGLVVVDEEQRFGIKDKERLKRLRAQIDVLTMSATPIPRTLQMGFFGIRDMSIIETPPIDRRAIRTSIIRFDDAVIRESILRELSRGGQVYFVHNRVSSIQSTADHLRQLVPEAKIEVGHGQMDEKQLEDVMIRFIKHDFNVLVCTTIIETGIDVPCANTMFIDNADDFGLAQLYQLRGRVGRSKERAFAYLVIPSSLEGLTPIARKRLEILHRFSELGAGFKIAQHDLELRGAGDLLGKSQHGHIAAVGYDLYVDLLKEAVEDLKGKAHHDAYDPDVNLPLSALIPDTYVSDLHDRMGFYQQFATAIDYPELLDILGLLGDQFGDPPVEVINLADIMVLKQKMRRFGGRLLEAALPNEQLQVPQVIVALGEHSLLHPDKITAWIKREPQRLTLTPKMKLIYRPDITEWKVGASENLLALCKQVLDRIISEGM